MLAVFQVNSQWSQSIQKHQKPLTFGQENLEDCPPNKPHVWMKTPRGQARQKQFWDVVTKAPETIQADIFASGLTVRPEEPTKPIFFLYVSKITTKEALIELFQQYQKDLNGIRWSIEVRKRAQAY